jgi:hypothetical protein
LLDLGANTKPRFCLDFDDHRAICDRLDKVHAKHPDMVLLKLDGGSPYPLDAKSAVVGQKPEVRAR